MLTKLPRVTSQKHKKGQALVEFALVSPVLLLVIMAIMDFSHVILTYVQGVGALREAVRYAEVVGYIAHTDGTPRYLDCEGMERSARRVLWVDDHAVSIQYMKKDGTTTYTCDTVTSSLLENGDMLQINSRARVDMFTPLVARVLPYVSMNFSAQRTIIKDITLGLGYEVDSDFDGLLDAWEIEHFGDLSHIATENLDSDLCNLGCEESRLMNPLNPDTDGDGLEDHEEAYYHETNGTDVDTDDDSLPNQTSPTLIDLNDFIEVNTLRDFSHMPADFPDTRLCYSSPVKHDTDGDGLSDGEELTFIVAGVLTPTNPCDVDTDNDGLTDLEELSRGTDGTLEDTDGDGLNDREEEESYGTSPINPDTDGDNLPDGVEVHTVYPYPQTPDTPTCKTNPIVPDTDGDFINDDVELAYVIDGLPSPLNPCDPDWDNDGLSDSIETNYNTSPKNPDHDGDGLGDGTETILLINGVACLSPSLADSDGDGIDDKTEWELQDFANFNPCLPDTNGDGILDGDQYNGSDSDSDDDGLNDSWEMQYFGTLAYTGFDDLEPDGLTNNQEHPTYSGSVYYPGTNPIVADTDSDGLGDALEYTTRVDSDPNNNLDPNDPDTDNDGLFDGVNSFTSLGENSIPSPYQGCKTNPTLQDSDGDGLNDSNELVVTWSATVNGGSQSESFILNPCSADTDGDTLFDGINSNTNIGELLYTNAAYPSCKTHPNRTDTDGDGLSDSQEIAANTNPCDNDSDDDGLPDGLEIALQQVYPSLSALDSDSDNDNFTDYEEYCDRKNGTDIPTGYTNPKSICTAVNDPAWDTSPIVADTDEDGRLDGDERKQSTDPFYITDPMDKDTDDDSISDGQEMTNGTKPNNKITVDVTAVTTVGEADKSNDPALAQTITLTVTNNNGATPNSTSGSTEPIVFYWKTTGGSGTITHNSKTYWAALTGTDYVTVVGDTAITIPANTATITLTVHIIGDNNNTDSSHDEFFYIDILYPGDAYGTTAAKRLTNAKLGTARGLVLIDDRDS